MRITYIGPDAYREIPAAGVICQQGETVEVDDELGRSLLEQTDQWTKPKKNKE